MFGHLCAPYLFSFLFLSSSAPRVHTFAALSTGHRDMPGKCCLLTFKVVNVSVVPNSRNLRKEYTHWATNRTKRKETRAQRRTLDMLRWKCKKTCVCVCAGSVPGVTFS